MGLKSVRSRRGSGRCPECDEPLTEVLASTLHPSGGAEVVAEVCPGCGWASSEDCPGLPGLRVVEDR